MIMKFELTRDELDAMMELTRLVAESSIGIRDDGEIHLQVKNLKPLLNRVGFNTQIPFCNAKVTIVEEHDADLRDNMRNVMYEKMIAENAAKKQT